MALRAVQFQDLPIRDDIEFGNRAQRENEVLGDPPDWEKYRRIHLMWDPDDFETKAGYKLPIAREQDGRLVVVFRQLANAVAVLNGARGGVNAPDDVRRRAFNAAMRYYDKLDIPSDERPEFKVSASAAQGPNGRKGVTLQFAPVPPEAVGETDAEAKWVQVAYEGQFMGYRGGDQPFAFEREHFEQAIRNLHSNPSFQAGTDGKGAANVIPWDFNHASELHPADGMLPVTGSPSQGWTLDLEIRDGTDGKAQLWALTSYYEPARGYVKDGKYAWASVSAIFDAIHPVTGENIGMIITSIALTNTPFLEGMERLAATRDGAKLRGFFFEPAQSAEDALKQFREMFGLPETTDAVGVVAEIQKLAQWIVTGSAPLGVDVAELIGNARRILGLPALSTEQEVLDNASEIIQRLIEEQTAGLEPAAPAGGLPEDGQMLKKLAAMLGVTESESAVEGAVASLAALRDGVVKAFKLDSSAASRIVLEAAEGGASAREKLSSLLKALGVEDVDGGVEQVATLIQQAEELKAAMPELEGLRAKIKEADEASAETDVAEAMASYGLHDATKDALLLFRTSKPEDFKAKFPKKTSKGTPPKHLTKPVVAGPGGAQIPTGGGSGAPSERNENEINLDEYDGRNPTERAMTYLALNNEGWSNLSREAQHKQALMLKRQDNVTFTPIPAAAG